MITLGLTGIVHTKDVGGTLSPAVGRGGWWPYLREAFTGAWQRSVVVDVQDVLTHSTFWACATLIASDIAKMRITLTIEDADGICTETDVPAFSPVLRKPNHYQNRIKFIECWILSKLIRGNAYILKSRDNRRVVTELYVLDPARVQVLVAPDGAVFYSIGQDYLSGVDETHTIVPASEIIHDLMVPLYHPLVGVSPIFACGMAAMQGLKILNRSAQFFDNGSQPGGVLTAPGTISNEVALRLQAHWDANYAGPRNLGKVAVLGDGLTYVPMSMTAVDAQLIDQLKWGDERVCSTLHVPPYMVGVGPPPNYNNIEALNQQYYSQCLQSLIESIELCLDEGLALPDPYSIECDLEGLLRMDSATKMKTATDGVKGGIYTPNEGRKIFNQKPVPGGDTVYFQEQDHALSWLARRDALPISDPSKLPPQPPPEPVKHLPAAIARGQLKTRARTIATTKGLPLAA